VTEKRKTEIPEEIRGVYANQMLVTYRKEEFHLDFITRYPEREVMTARVIVSPGHLKRMVGLLKTWMEKYEEEFGKLDEPEESPKIKGSK